MVFIQEQGVTEADEMDGLDDAGLHLLAIDGITPVGTARILFEGETAKIGRVCVLKSHRGTGLGAGLITRRWRRPKARHPRQTRRAGACDWILQMLGFHRLWAGL